MVLCVAPRRREVQAKAECCRLQRNASSDMKLEG